jgi:TRAP-type C4-dicarboxylate transport system substrate-binding protein
MSVATKALKRSTGRTIWEGKMVRRFILAGACAGFALAAAAPVHAQNFKMLGGWSESNVMAYMPGKQFKENLDKASKGKMTVTISGPEAVKPFEQMQPVTAGAFEFIYTHGSYHDKGLAGVAEILPYGPDKLRTAGVWGAIDEHYQKTHNLKLLSLVSIGSKGYHCYFNKPLSDKGDWAGRKVRGVANQHAVIQALGGVPVVMDMGEVYSSIEKGVVDGACAPGFVFEATKHHEVAKYRVEPLFGLLVSLIGMNLDQWNKLSKEQQAMIAEVGAQTERDTAKIGDDALEAQNKRLAEKGVQIQSLPKEKAELMQSTFTNSNWGFAEKCCGDTGKKLRDLAIKAGMSK